MSALLRNLKFAWDYFVLGKHRIPRRSPMDLWVEPPPLEAQLWFGSLFVADLHRMFPHQGTWFSEYDLRITNGQGELPDQLLAYIAFCEDFHRRIAGGRDHDFAAFDRFTPIPNCESWSARLPTGRCVPMEGILWFTDGDAIWQHPETEPSTEVAASHFGYKTLQAHDGTQATGEEGAAPNPLGLATGRGLWRGSPPYRLHLSKRPA